MPPGGVWDLASDQDDGSQAGIPGEETFLHEAVVRHDTALLTGAILADPAWVRHSLGWRW